MASTGLSMSKVHWTRNGRTTVCGRNLLDIIVPKHTTAGDSATCAKCRIAFSRLAARHAEWAKRQSAEAD